VTLIALAQQLHHSGETLGWTLEQVYYYWLGAGCWRFEHVSYDEIMVSQGSHDNITQRTLCGTLNKNDFLKIQVLRNLGIDTLLSQGLHHSGEALCWTFDSE
jgi:hypothetical protein